MVKSNFGAYYRLLKSTLQSTQMRFFPGITKYPHRLVFIAGLPKSGTTWLENLIGAIPLYRRLACYDPNNLLMQHILDPTVIGHIPVAGNFYIKTHVEARKDGIEALELNRVPVVVMVRDLRDQCVSRFYHVLNNPTHRHYELYNTGNRSRAFSHCVGVSVSEYADWIRSWLDVIRRNNKQFMLVRYEDLREDVKKQFCNILNHFDISLEDDVIDNIIQTISKQSKTSANLTQRLKQGKNTFRAGRVGDWRDHFSVKDVEQFKLMANDVLVLLGYEKDLEWGI